MVISAIQVVAAGTEYPDRGSRISIDRSIIVAATRGRVGRVTLILERVVGDQSAVVGGVAEFELVGAPVPVVCVDYALGACRVVPVGLGRPDVVTGPRDQRAIGVWRPRCRLSAGRLGSGEVRLEQPAGTIRDVCSVGVRSAAGLAEVALVECAADVTPEVDVDVTQFVGGLEREVDVLSGDVEPVGGDRSAPDGVGKPRRVGPVTDLVFEPHSQGLSFHRARVKAVDFDLSRVSRVDLSGTVKIYDASVVIQVEAVINISIRCLRSVNIRINVNLVPVIDFVYRVVFRIDQHMRDRHVFGERVRDSKRDVVVVRPDVEVTVVDQTTDPDEPGRTLDCRAFVVRHLECHFPRPGGERPGDHGISRHVIHRPIAGEVPAIRVDRPIGI